jgi:hypothetical protein
LEISPSENRDLWECGLWVVMGWNIL